MQLSDRLKDMNLDPVHLLEMLIENLNPPLKDIQSLESCRSRLI